MERVKTGIIGCGAIGQEHLARINNEIPGAVVTSVYEISSTVSRSLEDKYGVKTFSSGEELINSDNVDAVVIASSDATHEQYVLECIAAGKHVLCEKPLTPTAEGSRRIVDAEIAGGKKLVQVGFMRRYDEGYKSLRQLIETSYCGSPLMLHCSHRNKSIPGFTTEVAIQSSASHELDICRWLLNDNYAACEVKLAKNSRHSSGSLHDPMLLILETATGVLVDIEIFVNCCYGYDINCEAVCEDGTLRLPVPSSVTAKHAGAESAFIADDWKKRFVQAYREELKAWVDSVKSDQVRGPSAWDGYMVSTATESLLESLKTGKRVEIPDLRMPEFYR